MRKILFILLACFTFCCTIDSQVVFDLSTDDAYTLFNLNGFTSNESRDGDIEADVSTTISDVTVTVSPSGKTNTNRMWKGSLRLYGGTLTVSAARRNITAIKFTINNSKWGAGNTADTGTLETGSWTGDASTVVITIAANTQLKKIEVYQVGDDGPLVIDWTSSAESPLTVAQVLEKGLMLDDNTSSSKDVYVKGFVTQIEEIGTINETTGEPYGNATYYIADAVAGESNQLYVFRGLGLNGAAFTSSDDLAVGDEVVVVGKIKKFVNSTGSTTIEVNQGNKLYSRNSPGPDPQVEYTPQGDGTFANPYNADAIRSMDVQSTSEAVASEVWVKAVVFGYITSGTLSANTIRTAPAEGEEVTKSNIVLIDDAHNSVTAMPNVAYMCPVNLPTGDIRDALNLADNSNLIGQTIWVSGDVFKYMGVPGLKNVKKYSLDGATILPGGDIPHLDPRETSLSNPYSVAELRALNAESTSEPLQEDAFVVGYIVGYINGSSLNTNTAVFSTEINENVPRQNILIADNPSTNDIAAIIPVQLLIDNPARADLNLADHPERLGTKVWLKGNVCKYFGVSGLKSVTDYSLDGINYTGGPFQLSFVVDGEVLQRYSLSRGETIQVGNLPTKEGYTFSGWSDFPATMPAHDVTITGSFLVNNYKLSYIIDGERVSEEDIAYNSYLSLKEEPTKEGYTFSGWSEIPETMPAHDVTVTGTFSINSYKLTYVLDGTTYSEEEIEYNTALTQKEALAKEGYTFSGWSEIPETMPAHDVTVTGSFSVNSYKLTYILDGEIYKEIEVAYGSTITPGTALEKEGYTFSGWSEIPETMPAHDVVVTASFTKGQYKLIYMVDGQVYKTFSNDYQNPITPESAPVREGYTFSGWDEVPETMPAHDVTVNGTFTINTYKLTYLLDGVEYGSFEIVYGGAVPTVETPEMEHHTFSGWNEIPETMPARDVVITGSLLLDTYKVIYKINDVVYKTVVVGYGLPITPEPAPVKEGYTFSGWSWIPSKMPAEDVIVTANFTPIKYELVYMIDGVVYKTVKVDYDSLIKPEATPVREGYTFSGWSWIPSRMPSEKVVITGSFTINHYTITYVIDDETYYTEVLDYGSVITPPEVPEREGCTFTWVDVPATMPAHDITIEGTYTDGIGLTPVPSPVGEERIYNLSGQRLSKSQRGVNIINGKKVIIR